MHRMRHTTVTCPSCSHNFDLHAQPSAKQKSPAKQTFQTRPYQFANEEGIEESDTLIAPTEDE